MALRQQTQTRLLSVYFSLRPDATPDRGFRLLHRAAASRYHTWRLGRASDRRHHVPHARVDPRRRISRVCEIILVRVWLTKRLQWMAGFRSCCASDALGPPPLKRVVEMFILPLAGMTFVAANISGLIAAVLICTKHRGKYYACTWSAMALINGLAGSLLMPYLMLGGRWTTLPGIVF